MMTPEDSNSIPSGILNQRGVALLYLVIMFVLLGVLASTGSRILGPLVAQRKITDTKAELERDVQSITAWGIRNGRLPVFSEYTGVFGGKAPMDSWGKPVVYSCDSNLSAAATGGICGRTVTTGQEMAFLLISGGDDLNITSTVSIAAGGSLTGLLSNADLYRAVTLKELQALAGCSGTAMGSLRIVNNELPNACRGVNYTATVYGEGGVPSISYAFSGLPSGLTSTGGVISGATAVAKGTYPVTVTATDSAAASVQRKYILNVMSSCH